MTTAYRTIPECGWPCRLDPDNEEAIDLNDGSVVRLENSGNDYVWYDINGGEIERFQKDTDDYNTWSEVHAKLKVAA